VRLAEEALRLRSLKVCPKDLALRIPVYVGPTGTVLHDGHPYSMPPEAISMPATLYLYADAYPPVGLAVTLLVILMVCPPIVTHGSSVDFPQTWYASPMPRAVREDALSVAVTRDGKIYFRNTAISAEELPGKIREGLKNSAEKKVYLRADARARYVDVKQVLIEIRQAGIENVCFLRSCSLYDVWWGQDWDLRLPPTVISQLATKCFSPGSRTPSLRGRLAYRQSC
jgi:biopolymer transport protein TolR